MGEDDLISHIFKVWSSDVEINWSLVGFIDILNIPSSWPSFVYEMIIKIFLSSHLSSFKKQEKPSKYRIILFSCKLTYLIEWSLVDDDNNGDEEHKMDVSWCVNSTRQGGKSFIKIVVCISFSNKFIKEMDPFSQQTAIYLPSSWMDESNT